MKTITEILKSLTTEDLLKLAKEINADTLSEESITRKVSLQFFSTPVRSFSKQISIIAPALSLELAHRYESLNKEYDEDLNSRLNKH